MNILVFIILDFPNSFIQLNFQTFNFNCKRSV